MTEQARGFKEGDLVVVKPEYADVMYEAYKHLILYGTPKSKLGKNIALGEPAIVLRVWDDEMWITDKDDRTGEFIAPLTQWFTFYKNKAMDAIDHLL